MKKKIARYIRLARILIAVAPIIIKILIFRSRNRQTHSPRDFPLMPFLPLDGTQGRETEWEALGVKLGEVSHKNPQWRHAIFPKSWSMRIGPNGTHYLYNGRVCGLLTPQNPSCSLTGL